MCSTDRKFDRSGHVAFVEPDVTDVAPGFSTEYSIPEDDQRSRLELRRLTDERALSYIRADTVVGDH